LSGSLQIYLDLPQSGREMNVDTEWRSFPLVDESG
jgi:hypothetical protein